MNRNVIIIEITLSRPGVEAPAHSVVSFEDVSFTNTSRHAWLRKTEIEMKRAFMIKIEKEKLAKEQRRQSYSMLTERIDLISNSFAGQFDF